MLRLSFCVASTLFVMVSAPLHAQGQVNRITRPAPRGDMFGGLPQLGLKLGMHGRKDAAAMRPSVASFLPGWRWYRGVQRHQWGPLPMRVPSTFSPLG